MIRNILFVHAIRFSFMSYELCFNLSYLCACLIAEFCLHWVINLYILFYNNHTFFFFVQELESIIQQMMSVARYLGWDVTELKPVSYSFLQYISWYVFLSSHVVKFYSPLTLIMNTEQWTQDIYLLPSCSTSIRPQSNFWKNFAHRALADVFHLQLLQFTWAHEATRDIAWSKL